MNQNQFYRLRRGLAYGLIFCAVFLLIVHRGPKESFSLVSDTGGAIREVVCTVNSARRSQLPNASLASAIINALSPGTKVILAVNDPNAFRVAVDPWPGRVRFLRLPFEAEVTIWPQDPFVVLSSSSGHKRLMLSAEFERADDLQMARELAGFLGWPMRQSKLTFEGGNIVSDDQFIYVGSDAILLNASRKNEDPEKIVRLFEGELGKPVWVVGPSPQPIGHIDMMMCPLGEKKILLADPNWGARLASEQIEQSPEQVKEFERSCRRMFFGDPRITHLYDADGRVILPPHTEGLTREAIRDSRAMARQVDQIAAGFLRQGFEVLRIPYLSVGRRLEDPNRPADPNVAPAGPEVLKVRYPEMTYTNVLQETSGEGRFVYLPQYGWPIFDQTAREVWQKAGYQIIPIEGFAISAMYGGTMRCCTKILDRSP